MTNHTEDIFGSSKYLADTDGDGFGDLEEFARHSDPSSGYEQPLPSSLALNMSARGEADGLHLHFATFYTDGTTANKHYQLGMVANGAVNFIPRAFESLPVSYSVRPTQDGLNQVLLVDVSIPESIVHALGEVSFFATLALDSSPTIVAAAGVDLVSIDGVVVLLQDAAGLPWTSDLQSSTGGSGNPGGGPTSGAIYRPIPTGGGGVPQRWSSGMVCFQVMVDISSEGGLLAQEVVAADCISDVDASCPPSCAGTVGEVHETFDPIGLIGG